MRSTTAFQALVLAIALGLVATALAPSTAVAAWPTNGLLLTPQALRQDSPVLVPDGAAGAIIAWYGDLLGGSTNIFTQRVDSTGAVRWSVGGVAVGPVNTEQFAPALAPAPNRGAAVAWMRRPKGTDYNSYDVYAQRLDSLGNAQWGAGGIPIATTPAADVNPIVVSNGSSGVLDPIGYYIAMTQSGTTDSRVRLQFVDLTGVGLWTPAVTGGVLLSATGVGASVSSCIQDGVGTVGRARGAFVAWTEYGPDPSGPDVRIQRVTPAGTPVFASGGVLLCGVAGSQAYPHMALVGGGNVVVAWQDGRASASADIYAQKINTSGAIQWAADGVPVCRALGYQSPPTVFSDGAGGAIIVWLDARGDSMMTYAQRLNSLGQPMWALDGVPVTTLTASQHGYSAVSDGQGGAIVCWGSGYEPSGEHRAQRIDPLGQPLWGVTGKLSDATPGVKVGPALIPDGRFGVLAAWTDGREGTSETDIYAYRITAADGLVDVPPAAAGGLRLTRTSSNPTTHGVSFRLDLAGDRRVKADVFDLHGRRVSTLEAGTTMTAGTHRLAWSGRDAAGAPVAPGLYLVRVLAGADALTERVVVVH